MTVKINRLKPLGVAAPAVVALRAVAGAPSLVPGADVVYDGVMVILSLVTTAGAIPAAVGNLALWLLYIGLFYRVVPEVVPDSFDAFSTDRGLVGIVAVSSVSFGAIAFAPIVEALMRLRGPKVAEPAGLEVQITILTAVMLVTTAVAAGYVAARFGDPLNQTSTLYEFNAAVVGRGDPDRPERLAARFREAGGWVETYGRVSGYLVVGAVLAFVCLGLGGFTVVLAGFSPLPELLLMTVVTYRYAPISAPVSLGTDVEWNIQQSVRVVFQNAKGRSAIFLFLFGLFVALGTVVLGVSRLQAAAWRMRRSGGAIADGDVLFLTGGSFSTDLAWIGAAVCLLAAGLLFFWYFERLAERLPAFVRAWEGVDEPTPTVTRPPGSVVVPASLLCLGLAPLAATLAFERDTYQAVHRVIAFFWPLGLVIAGYWIYATAQAAPQPASTDRFAAPLALGGMLLPIAGVSAIVGDRLPTSPLQILLLWTAVTAWYLLPDLARFIRDTPLEPYLGAISLSVAGTVLLVAALIAPDDALSIAVVGAVFCFFVSGLVMLQGCYFDRLK